MSELEKRLITPPATEPVSAAEAKLHCRVDGSVEDALIAALITAARMHVEEDTSRALIEQTWEVVLEGWPRVLRLPHAPVSAVSSITYRDADGVTATLAATAYTVRTGLTPVQVIFDQVALPSATLAEVGPITVRYVAGYGATAASVPKPIYQAMLLLIGHWYTNREAVAMYRGITTEGAGPLAFAVDALLQPYRMNWFGGWVA